ncbi:unnamed protein product [Hapterophycus canaliculatus]
MTMNWVWRCLSWSTDRPALKEAAACSTAVLSVASFRRRQKKTKTPPSNLAHVITFSRKGLRKKNLARIAVAGYVRDTMRGAHSSRVEITNAFAAVKAEGTIYDYEDNSFYQHHFWRTLRMSQERGGKQVAASASLRRREQG